MTAWRRPGRIAFSARPLRADRAGGREPITGATHDQPPRDAARAATQVAAPQPTASRVASYLTRTMGFANDYLYTGRRLDEETGLHYYRNRHYDARLGRFVSRDPIGYWGSAWNLYEYVSAAVTIRVDPFGLVDGFWGHGHVPILPRKKWAYGGYPCDPLVCGDLPVVVIGSVPESWPDIVSQGPGIHINCNTNDDLCERVGGIAQNEDKCISTLIVAGHGSNGGANLNDDRFGAGNLTPGQIDSLRENLCDDAVVILGACHNESGIGARKNTQRLADVLGVKVCFCPAGCRCGKPTKFVRCEQPWICVSPKHPKRSRNATR